MHIYSEKELLIAEAIAAENRAHAQANPHDRITKSMLFELGRSMWPFSYKIADDDAGAARALLMKTEAGLQRGDLEWTRLAMDLLLPQHQLAHSASALWCHQGFPQVVMGHKYAAALLSTKLSFDVADQVRAPWRAFYIEVPHGLLFAFDTVAKKESTITGILAASVFHAPSNMNKWAYFAISESQVTLWQHGAGTEHMLGSIEEGAWKDSVFVEGLDDLDKRCSTMIGRLVLNTCLAMSDPTNVKPPRADSVKGKKNKHNTRDGSEPKIRTYQLGSTPAIDCREHVAHYMRTGRAGGPLNVQIMVAGHWKNVVHGPARALRRVQWLEPYWKGDEQAPILVKPRTVKL